MPRDPVDSEAEHFYDPMPDETLEDVRWDEERPFTKPTHKPPDGMPAVGNIRRTDGKKWDYERELDEMEGE